MKVYSKIRHRHSYDTNFKTEYIGISVNMNNEEELPIGTKFILGNEYKTSNNEINYNVQKLNVFAVGTINDSSILINSGTYNKYIDKWVATGYVCDDNGDGTWSIVKKQ